MSMILSSSISISFRFWNDILVYYSFLFLSS